MVKKDYQTIEIYNPGGLPSGLDPKKFGTKSVPRNLLIASMLHRVNYIEQAGTGINRIKEAIANHKKKVELDIQYGDDSIFYSVIFRRKRLVETTQKRLVENNKNIKDFSYLERNKVGRKGLVETTQKRLVENQFKILELVLKDPKVSKHKMSKVIGISTTAIDKNISILKRKGFIKRVGSDKAGYWKVVKK